MSGAFCATRVCKPGSVLTAIYLALQLLTRSSRLLEAVGQTCCFSTALLRDRVYIVIRALLEKLIPETADLLPQCVILDTLKYIQYSCGIQNLPCAKISRCSERIFSAKYPTHVTMGRVGSYPTFSPLPAPVFKTGGGRYISVALVLRSPSAGVTRYPCPAEPGLSSSAAFRHASAAVRPGRGNIVPQAGPNVKYPCKFFSECIYYG